MTVLFNIRRTKNEEKLRLSISFGRGQQMIFSSPFSCPHGKFDTKTQKIKSKLEGVDVLNAQIQNVLYNVRSLLQCNQDVPLEELKPKIREILNNSQYRAINILNGKRVGKTSPFAKSKKVNYRDLDFSVVRTIQKYLEDNKSVFQPETTRKYEILITLLEKAKMNDADIRSINHDWCHQFREYLINKRKQNNDTIRKNFSALKAALRTNKKTNPELFTYKLGLRTSSEKKLDVLALTPSEIKKLEEIELPPLLDRIRDLWLFQMYTSQRISDVKNYSPEQIQDGSIGPIWEFTAQKTGKLTTVPLYGIASRAYEILQKYDFELPVVVEQYLNREIKKVAKLAGLTRKKHLTRFKGNRRVETAKEVHELISSHSARRTGITRLLGEGIPLNLVQMISQHSDIKTLMKYSEPEKETLLNAFG